MDKQKNKILTLRVSQDTRDKAHKAAALLHDQTLSEFLTNKLDRLLFEYDREAPQILKIAKRAKLKESKQRLSSEGEMVTEAPVSTPKSDRDSFKAQLLYFVDSGININ